MTKNKILILIGLAAVVVFVGVGIWVFSTQQTKTPQSQNLSPEVQDGGILEEDTNSTEPDSDTGDNIVSTTPPPTTVTPPPSTTTPPSPPPTPPAPQITNVSITNFAYVPVDLRIKQGTIVIWTNNDSVGHTVTSSTGTELNSPLLGKDQTYSHVFDTKGEFSYYCKPHPWMTAKVIVD